MDLRPLCASLVLLAGACAGCGEDPKTKMADPVTTPDPVEETPFPRPAPAKTAK